MNTVILECVHALLAILVGLLRFWIARSEGEVSESAFQIPIFPVG